VLSFWLLRPPLILESGQNIVDYGKRHAVVDPFGDAAGEMDIDDTLPGYSGSGGGYAKIVAGQALRIVETTQRAII
jgi:hypothetical protein